jgi:hypothetical protein
MGDWVYLTHPDTGGAGRFPNDQSVIDLYVARGWEQHAMPPELDPDSPNNDVIAQTEPYEMRIVSDESAALKGKSLDDALDKAGLSKTGSADEKRARLAEYEAGLADTTPEGEVNG